MEPFKIPSFLTLSTNYNSLQQNVVKISTNGSGQNQQVVLLFNINEV
jgi:hypothetical protein